MGQLVTDNFDRADSTGLGANWTSFTNGNLNILTNRCVTGNVSDEALVYYSGAGWTGGNDQYAEATIITLDTARDMGPAVRISGTSQANANAYFFIVNSTDAAVALGGTIQCSFYKQVSGTFTQIGTDFGIVVSSGDVIRLEVQGTSLRAYKNGSQVSTTQTDSSLASGNPGLYISSGSSGSSKWDDFAAGDFGAGAAATDTGLRSRVKSRPAPFKPMGDAFQPAKYGGWR